MQFAFREACLIGCGQKDTCLCPKGISNMQECDEFNEALCYYVEELIEDACTNERGIRTCLECDDYKECKYYTNNC